MAKHADDRGVGAAPAPRRGAGELEAEVLGALWAGGGPLTPTQLLGALGGELAYNTVHTILTRLREKGLVVRTTLDGHPAYAPAQGAAEWSAGQMRAVLERGADRTAILHRFVSSLDPADERALRAALSEDSP
ncbi:BlaI/MecI/CopY family transcriptional regulator [Rugosimonospora acidiphila]|uniref:BlaI/MecI/CopY family transcriptional regulator n=1 Tax=Rugosimonospora acidiphila TaxID=556531 RepID=A0ABP9SST8_9ACTN